MPPSTSRSRGRDSILERRAAVDAAAILYAIGSPETYRLLVVDRGWSGARFERWYGETLERLLLGPAL